MGPVAGCKLPEQQPGRKHPGLQGMGCAPSRKLPKEAQRQARNIRINSNHFIPHKCLVLFPTVSWLCTAVFVFEFVVDTHERCCEYVMISVKFDPVSVSNLNCRLFFPAASVPLFLAAFWILTLLRLSHSDIVKRS